MRLRVVTMSRRPPRRSTRWLSARKERTITVRISFSFVETRNDSVS